MSIPEPYDRHSLRRHFADLLAGTAKATAFWAAVALPLTYPPLLYAGLDGLTGYLFVSLLFANALALAIGHTHNYDT